jgi:guanylate kinase
MNKKGKLYIISAPSGTGKSTVIRELLKKKDNAFFSVSATTREPREGEVNGVNYWFLTRPEFERMVEEGAFLEHAQYVGNYYGTPLQPILDNMAAGNDAILDIEVQGFRQIKQKMPEAVSIFIVPPSMEELEHRLRAGAPTRRSGSASGLPRRSGSWKWRPFMTRS